MSKFALLATLAALSGPVLAQQPAASPWAAVAKADLDFVYSQLEANHPGAVDTQNPQFREWMDRGYREASVRASEAASLNDTRRVLARYVAGFADGHLQVSFSDQSRSQRWPGMFVQREGERYLISHREEHWPTPLPPAGAELLSCDGKAVDAIMNDDILPALFDHRGLDWLKTAFADALFEMNELAPHAEYARCTVRTAQGPKDYSLTWAGARRVDLLNTWYKLNPRIEKRSTITRLGPKQYWVNLPVFSPDDEQVAQLKEVIGQMEALRTADLVVFDVRGNGGGNSQWGDDVLAGLYGKDYMDGLSAASDARSYAEWRVSKDNLAYVEGSLAQLEKQFGAGTPAVAYFAGVASRMKPALAGGQPFIRPAKDPSPTGSLAGKPAAPLSQARAILVTDYGCASSCLDFADSVMRLPQVKHFGQTTSADTVFMDIRRVSLPSGLGTLVLPQKVYRGRERANNQAYVPHRRYDGKIGDTRALQAWVLEQAGK